MDELAGEALAIALKAAGASPVLTDSARLMTPKLLSFARKHIEGGRDPVRELDLLMSGAEEAARLAFIKRYGEEP